MKYSPHHLCLLLEIAVVCLISQVAFPVQSTAISSTDPLRRGLSLEEKVGQMLQVRIHADYDSAQSPEFVAELGNVVRYHAGLVDLRAHMDGPNLVRPQPELVARNLNAFQKASDIPLLVGADIERGVIARASGKRTL
jgi:hypothetical protein